MTNDAATAALPLQNGIDKVHNPGAGEDGPQSTPHADNAVLSPENKSRNSRNLELLNTVAKPLQDQAQEDFRSILDFEYESLGQSIFKREKESGRLRNRQQQAALHLTFTELRLKDLETELEKLKARIFSLPEDHKWPKRKDKLPVYQHTIKRSTFDKYRITSQSIKISSSEQPALEVLISNQGPKLTSQSNLPERLRIRSRPLIIHLERVTGREFPRAYRHHLNDKFTYSSTVFLRPFKIFMIHAQDIRESVRDVEAAIEQAKEAASKPAPEGAAKSLDDYQEYDNEDLLQDLKLLIEFIDVDLKPFFDLRESIKEGTVDEIEYNDLWHLFSRGDLVISQLNREHAYRVINFTGGRELLMDKWDEGDKKTKVLPKDGFTIDCLSLRYDGSSYIPKFERFSIRKFVGRQPIVSLSAYPIKFDASPEDVREKFAKQGSRYLEVTLPSFSHKMFTGKTLDEPSHELDAQVIVDMTLAINNKPDWRPKALVAEEELTTGDTRETREPVYCCHIGNQEGCCGGDVIFKDLALDQMELNTYLRANGQLTGPRKAADLADDELMLLPHWVYGFVLRSRQWVTLRTADLSEVKFENDFDELILPELHKQTVQALVKTHENARGRSSSSSMTTVGKALDLVRGKGTGLVILLHGEPGVGKTSTAECVADNTKRPLFPITCGDIGETATEVEANLYNNFRLAHKWGCVLLLDEADVFLAKRNKTDLRRNAVTSVFLRSLEYYAGILFLTTNRVGGIDPAFKSRIHISLFYPRLDLNATRKLYEVFIERTRAEQKRTGSFLFKVKEKEILRFAERNFRQSEREGLGTWNGRQIRNAFQTAIALTEHESHQAEPGRPLPTLGKAQFHIVADGSREFDRYLISTLGAAEADIAMREEWRADRFAGAAESAPAPRNTLYRPTRAGLQSAKDPESEDETETESDGHGGDDDDDDDSGRVAEGGKTQGWVGGAVLLPPGSKSSKAERTASTATAGKSDLKEHEEFLRWKRGRR